MFWCLEHDLESLKGINFVQSGYSGGDLQNPTYENHEGHQEVVLVNYDSKLVSLHEILRLYLRNIDPLDGKGQFCDRGDSYRPVIFYKDSNQKSDAKNAIVSASNELGVPLEKIWFQNLGFLVPNLMEPFQNPPKVEKIQNFTI